MFYVYALRSLKDGNLYIGMTSNVELRLIADRLEARNLEKYYKTGCERELLKQL
jgi:predicted GIY-YIG superfamily endonuclease